MFQCTSQYNYLFEPLFSVMWGIYMPRTIISESYDNSIFVFWRNQKHFPQELHHFTFPPAKDEGVISYMFIDTIFHFKKWEPSCKCEAVSHYSFDFHFPDDWGCWVSFHVFIAHLYILFGETSIQVLAHFLIGLFVF